MFLMSMERSAILRSVRELALCALRMGQDGPEYGRAHTSDDLDVVARDELDGLLSLGRHGVDGCVWVIVWYLGRLVVGMWKCCWSVVGVCCGCVVDGWVDVGGRVVVRSRLMK